MPEKLNEGALALAGELVTSKDGVGAALNRESEATPPTGADGAVGDEAGASVTLGSIES